ncbi:hypothetical protein HBB16_19235 [Pseudonocardia sp. MCCB 268]|nr:hypothetical protein [Pseudonocardia cytotoxica]
MLMASSPTPSPTGAGAGARVRRRHDCRQHPGGLPRRPGRRPAGRGAVIYGLLWKLPRAGRHHGAGVRRSALPSSARSCS